MIELLITAALFIGFVAGLLFGRKLSRTTAISVMYAPDGAVTSIELTGYSADEAAEIIDGALMPTWRAGAP